MNERTRFFKKISLPHFILKRVMFVVCERWAGDGDRLPQSSSDPKFFWPKVLLIIAAFLSHLGWVAQPWVTEGPKPSVCRWLSIRHLISNWLEPSGPGYIRCLTSPCFRCSSAYLHRCISWLTALLQGWLWLKITHKVWYDIKERTQNHFISITTYPTLSILLRIINFYFDIIDSYSIILCRC